MAATRIKTKNARIEVEEEPWKNARRRVNAEKVRADPADVKARPETPGNLTFFSLSYDSRQ